MRTSMDTYPIEGGCDCHRIRYRLQSAPLFVHCCHCRWCQRESGASFALNAMIEADRVQLVAGEPERIDTPSDSGEGQAILRCPACKVALWSHYAGAGPWVSFVRVGTLDDPDRLPPDIHIFTASKQPWVVLPEGTPAVPEYYDRERHWPAESLARRQALLPRIEAWQAAREPGGLERVERSRLRALVERDIPLATSLHAPDFQLVTPTGSTYDRERYLGEVASGALRYLRWDPGPMVVRHFADGAALRYRAELQVDSGTGAVTLHCWHTDVYEWRDRRWQVVWSQATAIRTPA